MNTFPIRRFAPLLASVAVLAIACSSGGDTVDETGNTGTNTPEATTSPVQIPATGSGNTQNLVLPNVGISTMEGHTPRGFRGSGTGLFAGDNLNSGFPNGEGVQFFLTFDIAQMQRGRVVSATLRSDNFNALGTPFDDLGALNAIEMRWDRFSPDLWDVQPAPAAATCEFASSSGGPFECDLGDALQNSLDDGYGYAQFRLRFDRISDSDGAADLAAFYLTNSNTNESGIFELVVQVVPSP